MYIINNTISFAPQIEKDAISWIKSTYIPLLESCPIVTQTFFAKVHSNVEDAQLNFVIQTFFANEKDYTTFCEKYKNDFAQALLLKLGNNFGVFTTVLEKL